MGDAYPGAFEQEVLVDEWLIPVSPEVMGNEWYYIISGWLAIKGEPVEGALDWISLNCSTDDV